jgi:hypothetical protein
MERTRACVLLITSHSLSLPILAYPVRLVTGLVTPVGRFLPHFPHPKQHGVIESSYDRQTLRLPLWSIKTHQAPLCCRTLTAIYVVSFLVVSVLNCYPLAYEPQRASLIMTSLPPVPERENTRRGSFSLSPPCLVLCFLRWSHLHAPLPAPSPSLHKKKGVAG